MAPRKEKAETRKTVIKTTKTKAVKDPNAPKRAPSAYLLFSNAKRPEVKIEFPADAKSVMKKLGEMWKELEDKSEWQEKAKVAKAAYDRAMKDYKIEQQRPNLKDYAEKARKRQAENKEEKTGKKTKVVSSQVASQAKNSSVYSDYSHDDDECTPDMKF